MSNLTTLYQTVAFKNSIAYIEGNGPFLCNRDDAWLGEGYYFWDSLIDNAHFWGKKSYNNEYYICEFKALIENSNCFNLLEPKMMLEFREFLKTYQEYYKDKSDKPTLKDVLVFIRRKLPLFFKKYKAIKLESVTQSKYIVSDDTNILKIIKGRHEEVMLAKLVQVCIYDKDFYNIK